MKVFVKSICFLSMLLFCSLQLYAQRIGSQTIDDLNGSPAGSRLLLFIDLIATNKSVTPENSTPFSQNWYLNQKLQQLNDSIKEIRAKYGSFILYETNRLSFFEFEMLVKATNGHNWRKIKVKVQSGPPYGIENYEILMANPPAASSTPLYIPKGNKEGDSRSLHITKEGLNELDSDIKTMVKNGEFSGAVLVAEKWKPVFNKAYGVSNSEAGIANNTDTKFNIGSINKVFTGISILQLVQQGKISLDDKAIKYLPNLSHPDASKVTIAQLLQHKSGYGMYWDNEFFLKNLKTLRTIDEYMAFLKDAPIAFNPGSRQVYSNIGYIFLGAIIEKITGKSYYEYIQENIFNTAAMKNSGFDTREKNMAIGYTKGFGEEKTHALAPNSEMQPIMGTSAGGGYSTAKDMLLFFKTLYACKFLNKELTALFTNNYNKTDGQLKNWTAGGGSAGLEALCKYDYKLDLLIVALSNFDPPSAQTLIKRAENHLFKESKN